MSASNTASPTIASAPSANRSILATATCWARAGISGNITDNKPVSIAKDTATVRLE